MRKIIGIAATLLLVAGIGFGGYWAYTHPSIRIVNASEVASLNVFVDDVQVVSGVEQAKTEEAAANKFTRFTVAAGEHTLIAKDASGKVIDSQKVMITPGGTYLYSPAKLKTIGYTLQTDSYGNKESREAPLQELDPSKSFWKLSKAPDYWFQDTPDSVKDKASKTTTKSALRLDIHEESNS